jgi:hypothetical protein
MLEIIASTLLASEKKNIIVEGRQKIPLILSDWHLDGELEK